MSRIARRVAGTALIALIVTGCSTADEGDSGDDRPPTDTTVPTETTSTSPAPDPNEAPDLVVDDICDSELVKQYSALVSAGPDTSTEEGRAENAAAWAVVIRAAQRVAPAELVEPLETLAAFQGLPGAGDTVPGPEAVQSAAIELDTYMSETCYPRVRPSFGDTEGR